MTEVFKCQKHHHKERGENARTAGSKATGLSYRKADLIYISSQLLKGKSSKTMEVVKSASVEGFKKKLDRHLSEMV